MLCPPNEDVLADISEKRQMLESIQQVDATSFPLLAALFTRTFPPCERVSQILHETAQIFNQLDSDQLQAALAFFTNVCDSIDLERDGPLIKRCLKSNNVDFMFDDLFEKLEDGNT